MRRAFVTTLTVGARGSLQHGYEHIEKASIRGCNTGVFGSSHLIFDQQTASSLAACAAACSSAIDCTGFVHGIDDHECVFKSIESEVDGEPCALSFRANADVYLKRKLPSAAAMNASISGRSLTPSAGPLRASRVYSVAALLSHAEYASRSRSTELWVVPSLLPSLPAHQEFERAAQVRGSARIRRRLLSQQSSVR